MGHQRVDSASRGQVRYALGLSAIAALMGCQSPQAPQGQVELAVQALSSTDVVRVQVTATGTALPSPRVFTLFPQATQWHGLISGLPVGANYTFTASCLDASGTELFHGQASGVTILKDQIASVVMTAQAVRAPVPFKNAAPIMDALQVSATLVAPGTTVSLSVTAHDPNPGDTLAYRWTATGGSWLGDTSTNPTWTAPFSEGNYNLALWVSDQKGMKVEATLAIRVSNSATRGKAEVTVWMNQWPVVDQMLATPAFLALGQASDLSVVATDADNDTLAFAWTSTCAGTFSAAIASPAFLLSAPTTDTTCTLSVVVTDGKGGQGEGELVLPIGATRFNEAPILVGSLASATVLDPGTQARFNLEALDPEGMPLTFQWTASAGAISGEASTATTSQATWTAPAEASSPWTVTVTVTDPLGASTAQRFSLTPATPLPVKILAINDFHGQISAGKTVSGRKVGSAAVLSAYLKAAMAGKENRSILVQAGDMIGASPASSALLQDEPAIAFWNSFANDKCGTMPALAAQSMDLSRFDVLFDPGCNLVGVPGNHEFDEGTDELMRLLAGGNHPKGPFLDNPWAGSRFPTVVANITKADGGFLFRPYVVKAIEGVKVAFVGAILRETPTIVLPSGVAGLTFGDEASAINSQVALLKSEGIKAIVVVMHQGGTGQSSYTGPTRTGTSTLSTGFQALIGRLDGDVDVVITGHSHAFANALVKNAAGLDTLVTQAYSAGTAYADIDLTIDRVSGDILAKTASIVTTYADTAPGTSPDAALATMTATAEAKVAPIAGATVANASAVLSRTQTTAGESPLGDLIAEAHRLAVYADFGITNPGGMRADLPQTCTTSPCTITWNDCFTSQPFANQVMATTLTGAQLYAALEQQWSGSNTASPKMLQISGFTYQWSANAAPGGRVVPGSVKKLDGPPIDLAATYRVALNNFLLGGGDGFSTFTAGTNTVAGPIDLDALITYLPTLPQPIIATTDGRITRLP